MKFSEVVAQTLTWLQRDGRVSYRALKREFDLDDEFLEDLKAELIEAKRLAVDENSKVLVWVGDRSPESQGQSLESSVRSLESEGQGRAVPVQTLVPRRQTLDSAAERRQLTVMFCDLVGSTALSAQLDPEELREVVQAYQETSTEVIQRYDGHIAQHLGDGLLVYFGYPVAHEDDAMRAVRAGLGIVKQLQNRARQQAANASLPHGRGSGSLQVRIGIHTGLVVIGEIGSSEKREILALGETPNLAARIQGAASPDEVMISTATYRLVEGLFECDDRGQPELKGVITPLTLYRVVKESDAHSRFEVVVRRGLTPLIGREHEYGLLQERWARVKDGAGQVVLLSGEPGIGKSRLVEALKATVEPEGARFLELHCSPYTQNSALAPVIEHLQRRLEFQSNDTSEQKLHRLVQALGRLEQSDEPVIASAAKQSLQRTEIASSPLAPRNDTTRLQEVVPLFATLLSLPHPEGYPVLNLSPQKQKEKTYEALVAWLCDYAKHQAVVYAWEDLHWADPSTLELLTLFLAQVPTTRLLAVFTYRLEFMPPWGAHSYLSQLTLSRLGRSHVETMVEKVTGGRALPKEVIQQIVSKTDGVPLFVEELTKSVVEAVGAHGRAPLQSLDIPSTLQDSLMARLDRLGAAKEIAQLGATIGREFNYDLLQAVSPLNEDTLQRGLRQLVEAELVFQSGVPPQARYLFKHALVQDTAYQSLLKSRRQQLHQQVAQVLVEQFAETVESQPELVAHHYTEAGLIAQAIPYWQQAGEKATQRSAYVEAINHLTKGIELLKSLPDTSERIQRELTLQLALGVPLRAAKGWAVPELERTYTRARELCQQIGDTPQLYPALWGLYSFYLVRADYKTARELGEQLLTLAQRVQAPPLLVGAHYALGMTLCWLGELVAAMTHLEQGIALYDPQHRSSYALLYGHDPGVVCLYYTAWVLWPLGFPDQALKRSQEALTIAHELSHPYSLMWTLVGSSLTHHLRRDAQAAQERTDTMTALGTQHGFTHESSIGMALRGCALVEQGQGEAGIAQIQQGSATYRALGAQCAQTTWLVPLAGAYKQVGQAEEGLRVLDEVLTAVHETGERYYEAELYRLKGELTLAQSSAHKEAEVCFLKAIDIARKQQAKSLELRATMSLARLWQQQATQEVSRNTQHEARLRLDEAHKLLAEVYNWFTEGFDTKDLQEAKVLIESLESQRV